MQQWVAYTVSLYVTCWQNGTKKNKKNITVRAHSATYKIIIKVGTTWHIIMAHQATLRRIFLTMAFWKKKNYCLKTGSHNFHNVRGKNRSLAELFSNANKSYRTSIQTDFCPSGTNQAQRQGLTDPNRPSASQSVALLSLCIGTVGQTGRGIWADREWERVKLEGMRCHGCIHLQGPSVYVSVCLCVRVPVPHIARPTDLKFGTCLANDMHEHSGNGKERVMGDEQRVRKNKIRERKRD